MVICAYEPCKNSVCDICDKMLIFDMIYEHLQGVLGVGQC